MSFRNIFLFTPRTSVVFTHKSVCGRHGIEEPDEWSRTTELQLSQRNLLKSIQQSGTLETRITFEDAEVKAT